MDISKTIAEMKLLPDFAENVGMILVHNGIVRAWSRADHAKVNHVKVQADHAKIKELCEEFEQREGIFKVIAHANEGTLKPTDDLLYIIVAGDIREHVKSALADLLDRIKSEAITKQEF